MHFDLEQTEFAKYLSKNKKLPKNVKGEFEMPVDILLKGYLIHEVFENCLDKENYEEMRNQAILAPLNKSVGTIKAFYSV